jgi:predicted dehydrogenase
MSTAALLPGSPLDSPESEPSRPLRVAVVGAGVMGKRHARVLASRPDRFELSAVMDVNEAAAADLARAYGAVVAPREVDAVSRADAVFIATPIGAHAPSVRCALSCGRHVLVEKPVAANARTAMELVRLAESTGVHLFVGHSERFNPVIRALAHLVDPTTIEAIALRRVGPRDRAGAGRRDEGVLVNLGVHDLDLAAYLTASPLLPVRSVCEPGRSGVEERAHVFASTVSGASVHVFVDQRPADAIRRRTISLTTASHVWRGDLLAPSLVRTPRSSAPAEEADVGSVVGDAIPLDVEEPLLAQALAFAVAVRGGPCREIARGLDGVNALVAAERARRQASPPCAGEGENLAPLPRF